MSKFIPNDIGVMGLTLTQIGLLLASSILLTVSCSVIYLNEWQRTAEITSIATGLSTLVEGMDSRCFENATLYYFPHIKYDYNISISTEYISVNAKGTANMIISIKERFKVNPWPQSPSSPWKGIKGLHEYLKNTLKNNDTNMMVNNSGDLVDPISPDDISCVKHNLSLLYEQAKCSLARNPLFLQTNKPISIEKAIIYFDTNGDGYWEDPQDKKQEFIFIYSL